MMGKEQYSMGNRVALGKVSNVKRWVHPYNELYNLFLDWTQKENGFFVCVFMLWQNINLMDPMGFLFMCCDLTFNLIDPWGLYLYVMIYGKTLNLMDPWVSWTPLSHDNGVHSYKCYSWSIINVMDNTFTWKIKFVHMNVHPCFIVNF